MWSEGSQDSGLLEEVADGSTSHSFDTARGTAYPPPRFQPLALSLAFIADVGLDEGSMSARGRLGLGRRGDVVER